MLIQSGLHKGAKYPSQLYAASCITGTVQCLSNILTVIYLLVCPRKGRGCCSCIPTAASLLGGRLLSPKLGPKETKSDRLAPLTCTNRDKLTKSMKVQVLHILSIIFLHCTPTGSLKLVLHFLPLLVTINRSWNVTLSVVHWYVDEAADDHILYQSVPLWDY